MKYSTMLSDGTENKGYKILSKGRFIKHQCNTCGKVLKSKPGLGNKIINNHIATVHGAKDKKCTECDYACVRQRDIDRHFNSVHANIREFPCIFCSRMSLDKFALKKTCVDNT